MATGIQKSSETDSKTQPLTKETLETQKPKQNETAAASIVSPDTIIQKKISRAERFGLPVLLSEEEKRTSRAKRLKSVDKREKKSLLELGWSLGVAISPSVCLILRKVSPIGLAVSPSCKVLLV
ncbi:hypothetical protein MKW94_015682 [Papaver nudicaule]|uniref:THO1-MOS11 C-terminal domain-containing protein n=1 Tax=Papaver nudicaule TaxID=74823 RepID=A0AA41VPE9_PAPNU|nr:hypothetical protein [Papaver nudicaule]